MTGHRYGSFVIGLLIDGCEARLRALPATVSDSTAITLLVSWSLLMTNSTQSSAESSSS